MSHAFQSQAQGILSSCTDSSLEYNWWVLSIIFKPNWTAKMLGGDHDEIHPGTAIVTGATSGIGRSVSSFYIHWHECINPFQRSFIPHGILRHTTPPIN